VLWLYVVALVAGGGVLGMQLVLSHDGDGDSDHAHDAGDAALWPMFTSMRFWTFALLAFGLFGTIATLLGSTPTIVLVLAVLAGFGSGSLASLVVRRLASQIAVSHASVAEAVGRMGRVVVALEEGRPGKIRIELRGEMHDLLARAEEAIPVGENVIVESMEHGVATVSRAPTELRLGS
jgi:membrane protein implicated in regulation of membrane protease activity